MAPTLKTSEEGHETVNQARQSKGWTIEDPRWLSSTSAVLDSSLDWDRQKYYAEGVSLATWKRFLAGKQRITTRIFKAFCQVLDVSWKAVVDRPTTPVIDTPVSPSSWNWDYAPTCYCFYGRQLLLATLGNWLCQQDSRLLILHGLNGIGKSSLAVKLVDRIHNQFDGGFWHPFSFSEPCSVLVETLLRRLEFDCSEGSTDLGRTRLQTQNRHVDNIDQLIEFLIQRRWLLVLDERSTDSFLELSSRTRLGPHMQQYYSLFNRLAGGRHTSTFLLTAREKPPTITTVNGVTVYAHALKGLDASEAYDLLKDLDLVLDDYSSLVSLYSGNPLALFLIGAHIRDFYDGQIKAFLNEVSLVVLDSVAQPIRQTLSQLEPTTKQIVCELTIAATPISREQIRTQLKQSIPTISSTDFSKALSKLVRCSLIEPVSERGQVCYTLQPIVQKLVRQVYQI